MNFAFSGLRSSESLFGEFDFVWQSWKYSTAYRKPTSLCWSGNHLKIECAARLKAASIDSPVAHALCAATLFKR